MPLYPRIAKLFVYNCNKYKDKDIIRFIDKLNYTNTSCLEYIATINTSGYGSFSYSNNKKSILLLAHRVAYELYHGIIIPAGMFVLHHCDNRKCCNPNHLFLGTLKDNAQDMINKGRNVVHRGEDCTNAKLTLLQVMEIRRLYNNGGYTHEQLGKMFGVNKYHTASIIRNEIWKDDNYIRTNFYDGRPLRWKI